MTGDIEKTQVLPMEVTDEVVRFYSPLVYRIAMMKTKSSHDAEDIFQDVFLKLVSVKKPFESEEHRKAWIIRVTINCCNSHFVAPWRREMSTLDEIIEAQTPSEDSDRPDISVAQEENSSDLLKQIWKLQSNMREVILLFYYEDLSIKEISQIVGQSEDTVKKRLSRARQKLKVALTE